MNTAGVDALSRQAIPSDDRWVVEIGVASFPYLADHRLQGVIVLPGSAYVAMALTRLATFQHAAPSIVEDLVFERAFIVPPVETRRLQIALSADGRGGWQFVATGPDSGVRHARGRLRVAATDADSVVGHLRLDDPVWQSAVELDGESLYSRLRALGNEFGQQFRLVDRCHVHDGAAVGWLDRAHSSNGAVGLIDTRMLDAAMQVLTAATSATEQTFVLVGCERISVRKTSGEADRIYARLRPGRTDKDECVGDAIVVNEAGCAALELAGVRLRCLPTVARTGRQAISSVSDGAPATIAIAATFTAEPIESGLSFWLDTLAIPATIQFAPYNQPFQQLLDPSSVFATNGDGANVLLLRLEDLDRPRTRASPRASKRAGVVSGDYRRFTVPELGEIAHLVRHETEFLYDEIFRRQIYLHHGIDLDDAACVIDVGANIGMFTLFVQHRAPDARVYAFEPGPPAYELLRLNTAAHAPSAVLFDCGLADTDAERVFTYYRNSPAFSGFAASPARDRTAIEAVVRNVLRERLSAQLPEVESFVQQLTRDRLESEIYRCRTRTLSSVLAEQDIDRVDLLKIDAEGSELSILRGLDDRHWPIVRQVVAEVHSAVDAESTRDLLRKRGFEVTIDPSDTHLLGTGFVRLFARRATGIAAVKRDIASDAVLERNTDDLIRAVDASRRTARVPCIVALCPRSTSASHHREAGIALDRAEARLVDGLSAIPGVQVISPEDLRRTYDAVDDGDPRAGAPEGIPYSTRSFAGLATIIARRYASLRRPPTKVIALDCDNTLWSGVCGEDGPDGVCVDAARRSLQEFVVRQRDAGTLVCLCSKSSPADVQDVFRRHRDMPLRLEQVAASRFSWDAKSISLTSMASELGHSLDSFVFIDDDAVECAEVRANLPEVVTLCLPEIVDHIPLFLDHVWAFDRAGATDEDRARAHQYRRERERRASHDRTITFASFLAALRLNVSVAPCTRAERARVAQLTVRTNQFRNTTIRRTEAELHLLLESGELECCVVRVEDRFGDYGLVGALLFCVSGDVLEVDSFLLSCRALGRGVEHRMLAALGEIARARRLNAVAVSFAPNGRNEPARRFLAAVTDRRRTDDGRVRFMIGPEKAARLVFDPASGTGDGEMFAATTAPGSAHLDGVRHRSLLYQHIADDLADVDAIIAEIDRGRARPRPPLRSAFTGPDDDIEKELVGLWQKTLAIEEVGIDDQFFELGGTSVLAVQMIAELNRRSGATLSTTAVFESTTIRTLAAMLRAGEDRTGATGQRRGQHRRERSNIVRARPEQRPR